MEYLSSVSENALEFACDMKRSHELADRAERHHVGNRILNFSSAFDRPEMVFVVPELKRAHALLVYKVFPFPNVSDLCDPCGGNAA